VLRTIHGECHYLWRTVDQEGNVLDILVQQRRDKHAYRNVLEQRQVGHTPLLPYPHLLHWNN
jgi:DDE domain